MAMSRSLAGTRFITRSSMRSSPAVIVSSPAIMRSVVDLPQPDGPSRTMNSPSSISSETSSTAGGPALPKRLLMRLRRTTAMATGRSLDRARRHALDHLLGEEDVGEDDRNHRDHQAGREHAGVVEVVAHEALDT